MPLNSDNPKTVQPGLPAFRQLSSASMANQGYDRDDYLTRFIQSNLRNPSRIPAGEVVDSFIGLVQGTYEYGPLPPSMYYVQRQIPYPVFAFALSNGNTYLFQRTGNVFAPVTLATGGGSYSPTGTLIFEPSGGSTGQWTFTGGSDAFTATTAVGAPPPALVGSWTSVMGSDTLSAVGGFLTMSNDPSVNTGFAGATPQFYIAQNVAEQVTQTTLLPPGNSPANGTVLVEVTGVRNPDGSGMILYYFNQVPGGNSCCCPNCGGRFEETSWEFDTASLTAITAVISGCSQCGISGHSTGAFTTIDWNVGAGTYAPDSGFWLPGGSFGTWKTLGGKDIYVEMGYSADWNSPNSCCVYLMVCCYGSTAESGGFNCYLLYFGTCNKNCSGTLTFTGASFPGYVPSEDDSFPTPSVAGACPQQYSPSQMADGIASITVSTCLVSGTLTLVNTGG